MTYTQYIKEVETIALGCKRRAYYKVMLLWPSEWPQYTLFQISVFGLN